MYNASPPANNAVFISPFVINSNEAENIRKKLNNSNIFFLEAIAYRTHPQTEQVLKLLKENIIGKITNIKSNFGYDAGNPKKNSRVFNNQLGGGSILDLGCYPITFSNLIANYNNKEKEIVYAEFIEAKSSKDSNSATTIKSYEPLTISIV